MILEKIIRCFLAPFSGSIATLVSFVPEQNRKTSKTAVGDQQQPFSQPIAQKSREKKQDWANHRATAP